MNEDTIVASYPAYKIVLRKQLSGGHFNGKFHNIFFTPISVDDKLGLKKETKAGTYYKEFKAGSVVRYAQEYDECPIAAIEQARARGHDLHWINGCGSMITSTQRPQETWIKVWDGMLVRFEGRLFTIKPDFNDNLKLVPFILPD